MKKSKKNLDIEEVQNCPIMNIGDKVAGKYKIDVYHATVDLESVCKEGLKSKRELLLKDSFKYKSGLGGEHSKNFIPFTDKPEIAKSLANTIKTNVLMSKWDAKKNKYVINFDNIKDWLNQNEEFSNDMSTDKIMDSKEFSSKYKKKDFNLKRGKKLSSGDLWEIIDKNYDICNIINSSYNKRLTKEQWENLKQNNIYNDLWRGKYSRRKWQVKYPKSKGFEVVYPTKEMAKKGIESEYVYVKTNNLKDVQQKFIEGWNFCYHGIREIAGGIPNPTVYNTQIDDLNKIDPEKIGVVQAETYLPHKMEDIDKVYDRLGKDRYFPYYGIGLFSGKNEEDIKNKKEWERLKKIRDKMDSFMANNDFIITHNDYYLHEIDLDKKHIQDLKIVDIKDTQKRIES